jgi:hypothetical protein
MPIVVSHWERPWDDDLEELVLDVKTMDAELEKKGLKEKTERQKIIDAVALQ